MSAGYWVAVRKNCHEGHEWIDIDSIDIIPDSVQRKVDQTNQQIPGWAAVHPVVRIAQVIVTEVPSS